MKSIWLLGLLSLLVMVAYNEIGGVPRAQAQSPDRSVIPTAPADTGDSDKLPARFSEYLFFHQTRPEELPVHAMSDVKTCPE